MKINFNRKFCIVGTGGFAREVLCCLTDVLAQEGLVPDGRVVFLDHEEVFTEPKLNGIPVIQNQHFNPLHFQTIVAIANPQTRKFVVNDLPPETSYFTLIHPTAVLSSWVKIGEGSIVCAGAVLTCNITLGNHVQLNLNTTVGHDCVLGNYFTSAPAVSISGNCLLGDEVYFGSNACIRQGVSVCAQTTIGMGGVVVANISEKGTYVGVPVKKISE